MASVKTSEDHFRNYHDNRSAQSQETVYTTRNGVPMPHPYEAQRVGENGPLLLQDFHLIDFLSHFDRECVPERVVHAKGSGAHGVYKTTQGFEELCMADMFQESKECPITIRFSTVGGESDSHDCARDPRGFSVKFRADEGNWDLFANNTSVFFLRDPAKFPHFPSLAKPGTMRTRRWRTGQMAKAVVVLTATPTAVPWVMDLCRLTGPTKSVYLLKCLVTHYFYNSIHSTPILCVRR